MPTAGLSPTFSSPAASTLKPFPFSGTSVIGSDLEVDAALLVGEARRSSISMVSSPNFRQPLSPFRTMTTFRVAVRIRPRIPTGSDRGPGRSCWILISLSLPLKVIVPLDFQVIASAFLSFSSPPRALIALSRMAFASLSSARAAVAEAGDEEDGKDRTEEPLHGIASMMRGTPDAGGRDLHCGWPDSRPGFGRRRAAGSGAHRTRQGRPTTGVGGDRLSRVRRAVGLGSFGQPGERPSWKISSRRLSGPWKPAR